MRGEEVGLNKDDNTDRLGDRNSDKGRVSKMLKLCGPTLWTGLNAQQQLWRKRGRGRETNVREMPGMEMKAPMGGREREKGPENT